MSAAQVLEQIERTRIAQRRAEAALAKLVDQAVRVGIGWPEIAARLGVSRCQPSVGVGHGCCPSVIGRLMCDAVLPVDVRHMV
jgi:hypothetical protein